MNRTFFVFLLLVCTQYKTFAGTNKAVDSLIVYEIKNVDLASILDSVVLLEKKCNYYSSDLLFVVKIHLYKDHSILQIESIGNEAIGHFYSGCFEHSGHIFLVTGQVDNSLLVKSKKKKHIKTMKGQKKTKGQMSGVEDDTFATCIYKYQNSKFVYLGRSSYCK